MFAVSHASTALLIKRRYPAIGLWPLLLGTQAILRGSLSIPRR